MVEISRMMSSQPLAEAVLEAAVQKEPPMMASIVVGEDNNNSKKENNNDNNNNSNSVSNKGLGAANKENKKSMENKDNQVAVKTTEEQQEQQGGDAAINVNEDISLEGTFEVKDGVLGFNGNWLYQERLMGKFVHNPIAKNSITTNHHTIAVKAEQGNETNPANGETTATAAPLQAQAPGTANVAAQASMKKDLKSMLEATSDWSGSFTMLNPAACKKRRKRVAKKYLTIPEKFTWKLSLKDNGTRFEVCDGLGRNRFGRFTLTGTLDLKTGAFKGWKHYLPLNSTDIALQEEEMQLANDGKGTRASKRQRVPNRMLTLDTSKQSYGFISRNGGGSCSAMAGGDTSPPVTLANYTLSNFSLENDDKVIKFAMARDMEFQAREIEGTLEGLPREKKAKYIRKIAQLKTTALVRRLILEEDGIIVPTPAASSTTNRKVSRTSSTKKRQRKDSSIHATSQQPVTPVVQPPKLPEQPTYCGQLYHGDMVDGLPHGFGTCVLSNGETYEGEWKYGNKHGKGILLNEAGELVYQGEFVEDVIAGRGTYCFTNGDRYDGEFKEGNMTGYGVYYCATSDSTYMGDMLRGSRHGFGTLSLKDGSYYSGEWTNDVWSGRGIVKGKSVTYDGTFKRNQFEGKGTCTYDGNGQFEGAFRNGHREGRGTYTFENGAVYEGRFRADLIDGVGTLKMKPDTPVKINDHDWFIPIKCHSEIKFVHRAAGFTESGE